MSLARTAEVLTVAAASDHSGTDGPGEVCSDGRASPPQSPEAVQLSGLITRFLAGEEEAFARLVEACAGRLFNFLLRFARNSHDAEDLAQETFLKAYRNLGRFDPSRPFLPWLFTIARRTALNHLRSVRPTEELSEDLVAGESGLGAVEALAARDDSDRLWRLARRLKPRQYQALWLRYGEGLELTEVAGIMRTNAIYLKVILHRARRALLDHARRAGMGDLAPTDP
jgi:RNA polymerase sigma-70 factor, ECF subfamily